MIFTLGLGKIIQNIDWNFFLLIISFRISLKNTYLFYPFLIVHTIFCLHYFIDWIFSLSLGYWTKIRLEIGI